MALRELNEAGLNPIYLTDFSLYLHTKVSHGVPKCSVLTPLQFILYMCPILIVLKNQVDSFTKMNDAETLVRMFVNFRLDYCNCILSACPNTDPLV